MLKHVPSHSLSLSFHGLDRLLPRQIIHILQTEDQSSVFNDVWVALMNSVALNWPFSKCFTIYKK